MHENRWRTQAGPDGPPHERKADAEAADPASQVRTEALRAAARAEVERRLSSPELQQILENARRGAAAPGPSPEPEKPPSRARAKVVRPPAAPPQPGIERRLATPELRRIFANKGRSAGKQASLPEGATESARRPAVPGIGAREPPLVAAHELRGRVARRHSAGTWARRAAFGLTVVGIALAFLLLGDGGPGEQVPPAKPLAVLASGPAEAPQPASETSDAPAPGAARAAREIREPAEGSDIVLAAAPTTKELALPATVREEQAVPKANGDIAVEKVIVPAPAEVAALQPAEPDTLPDAPPGAAGSGADEFDATQPDPIAVDPVDLSPVAVEPAEVGSAETEEALGLDPAARRAIQRRLTLAGFDTRGVDGIFGARTRAAVAEWQQARGLSATGYLGPGQLAALEQETEAAYLRYRQTAPAPEAEPTPAPGRRSVRERSASTGRYVDRFGCLREANGKAVPWFKPGCR